METNNIINIPEGYEIDKDQSNDRQIVLKKIERPRTWKEYCEMIQGKESFYKTSVYNDPVLSSTFSKSPYITEFDNKEDVEAFAALSKLIKLRKSWIGEWKPDWTNDDIKFTIITEKNNIVGFINYTFSCSMSFPTEEMRNDFLVCFKDLLEQAKPLL